MEQEQYEYAFRLNAADCGPWKEMQLDKLVNMIIEVATQHANRLGVGFDRLGRDNLSWVLSRLSLEFPQPVAMNGDYRLQTWVESLNRLFSERNFALVQAGSGEPVAWARTVWMGIDMDTRRAGDLTALTALTSAVNTRPCPIDKQGRLPKVSEPEREFSYRFATSDIDINRHVCTRRYIDLLTDAETLGFWDANRLRRLDVAFKREARYGETARVAMGRVDGKIAVEVQVEGQPSVLAAMTTVPR